MNSYNSYKEIFLPQRLPKTNEKCYLLYFFFNSEKSLFLKEKTFLGYISKNSQELGNPFHEENILQIC